MWSKAIQLTLLYSSLLVVVCTFHIFERQQGFEDKSQVTNEKVKVSLYYESLCPDCHEFIQQQLTPTWNIMANYLTIELIPYGNAERNFTDGHWHFTCQHGVLECEENLVHACAVDMFQKKNPGKLIQFVYCMTSHQGTPLEEKTDLCAGAAKITTEKINDCVSSPKAETLMLSMATKTEKVTPPLYEVPTVQINGVYDPSEQDEIDKNFKRVICNNLGKAQPEVCNQV